METSILGPMGQRQKTDLRLPHELVQRMRDLADAIGIPANAVYAVAAAQLVVAFSRLTEPNTRKRAALVNEMEAMFQKIVAEVRKSI